MPKSFRRLAAVAALAVLVLALPAAGARADELDSDAPEGPKLAAKYTGCALGLAFAPELGTALVAFLNCIKCFLDEFPT
jgi:hypothetical protein